MPRAEMKIAVNVPAPAVWSLIRDVEALCGCIPGVEGVKVVDQETAEVTVRERVGIVPLVLNLRARIDSEEPPRRLHATATAEHLILGLQVTLRGTASGTEVVAVMEVKGEGPLGPIIDNIFKKKAGEHAARFADCVRKRLGAEDPGRGQAGSPVILD